MGKFKTLHKSYIKVPENHRVNAQCNVSGGWSQRTKMQLANFQNFKKKFSKNPKNT